jgi:hypothetical protein
MAFGSSYYAAARRRRPSSGTAAARPNTSQATGVLGTSTGGAAARRSGRVKPPYEMTNRTGVTKQAHGSRAAGTQFQIGLMPDGRIVHLYGAGTPKQQAVVVGGKRPAAKQKPALGAKLGPSQPTRTASQREQAAIRRARRRKGNVNSPRMLSSATGS